MIFSDPEIASCEFLDGWSKTFSIDRAEVRLTIWQTVKSLFKPYPRHNGLRPRFGRRWNNDAEIRQKMMDAIYKNSNDSRMNYVQQHQQALLKKQIMHEGENENGK